MYHQKPALEGVKRALAGRGFAWPAKGVKDKDSVIARLMAFDALHNLTGLSASKISMLVSTVPSNTRNMMQRVERCYRNQSDRAAWIQEARDAIVEELAKCAT
ncbi:MAG: hypothetical protein EBR82_88430 [Caulobacteraceae bacterium]|nr:hypothetical protein [Caulobacteraceae bacterium]